MNAGPAPHRDPAATPDWTRVRADFPLLRREVHGKPLVYFDNAATAQKPVAVIDETARLMREMNANIHRYAVEAGQTVHVKFDCSARQWENRWFNTLTAWEVTVIKAKEA